jgi:hypothetical protein
MAFHASGRSGQLSQRMPSRIIMGGRELLGVRKSGTPKMSVCPGEGEDEEEPWPRLG